jgi:CTP:molybdopterin cytidylyltransferase MocA
VIAGLVLAAGAAARFGAPKQLAPLDGAPLLEHAVRAMAAVPAIGRVVVVLGAHADAIRAGVDLGGAEAVVCPDWAEGQAASLRCGVRALGASADAVVITLGDQPRITPAVIARFAALGAEHGRAARARAVYAGAPGHPVVLGADHLPAVRELAGDVGARNLLSRVGALEIECGGLCSPADVDTPEELEAMRT